MTEYSNFVIVHAELSSSKSSVLRVEQSLICVSSSIARDSLKDLNSLHLPSERFSPVRRASDGLTNLHKYQSYLEKIYQQTLGGTTDMLGRSSGAPHHSSLKQLQQECQQLQVDGGECKRLFKQIFMYYLDRAVPQLYIGLNPLAGRATFLSPTVHGRSDNIVVFP